MNRSELSIVIILRVIGICGLFAIPAIFLPYSWMNAIHESMGHRPVETPGRLDIGGCQRNVNPALRCELNVRILHGLAPFLLK